MDRIHGNHEIHADMTEYVMEGLENSDLHVAGVPGVPGSQ